MQNPGSKDSKAYNFFKFYFLVRPCFGNERKGQKSVPIFCKVNTTFRRYVYKDRQGFVFISNKILSNFPNSFDCMSIKFFMQIYPSDLKKK